MSKVCSRRCLCDLTGKNAGNKVARSRISGAIEGRPNAASIALTPDQVRGEPPVQYRQDLIRQLADLTPRMIRQNPRSQPYSAEGAQITPRPGKK